MRMSLLGGLWGGGRPSEQLQGAPVSVEGCIEKKVMSFVEAVSSSSEDLEKLKGARYKEPLKVKPFSGAKRPRSPGEQTCGRCFRTTHRTSECHHQVVCLRCAGLGHVAAKCKWEPRQSPKRKRIHVRSKHVAETTKVSSEETPTSLTRRYPEIRPQTASHSSLSLPLTQEIVTVREELALVVVVTILSGYVSDVGLGEVLPSVINRSLAGPLTPLNDKMYLVPLASRAEVNEVSKLDVVQFTTKDGSCSAKLAPWSAEIGAVDRASGDGIWVRIWNLPLHGWCWSVILEVLKKVGELVALSQEFKTNKCFVSALVRRRPGISLPIEIELNLGMRKYLVLLTDDKGKQTTYRADLGRFVLCDLGGGGEVEHQVRLDKQVASSREVRTNATESPSSTNSEGLVERSSRPVDDGRRGRHGKAARPDCTVCDPLQSMQRVDNGRAMAVMRPVMVECNSHTGIIEGSRREEGYVVEWSSHVDGGKAPPRLLVRGPLGRSELRGGTAGRSTDGTESSRREAIKPRAVLTGQKKCGVERLVARPSLGPEKGASKPATISLTSEVTGSHASMGLEESEVALNT